MKKTFIVFILFFMAQAAYAYNDAYYSALYQSASQAITQGNETEADFYLAKYIGSSFFDADSKKSVADLYSLFGNYKVSKPTSLISGKYSKDFIDWFIIGSNVLWGRIDDTDMGQGSHSFCIVSNANDKYFVSVIGSPYLEGWRIIKGQDSGTAVLTLIDCAQNPYIVIGEHENSAAKKLFSKTMLDLDGHNVQHIWLPEFHDLNGDGKDELWIRYNKAWADGFSQELAIYEIKASGLELLKKFEGKAEGIARRLNDNTIQVGTGFTEKENTGHLGYDQHHLEVWQYKNGDFIKVSEQNIPHILQSDEWFKYYFDKQE